MAQSGFFKYPMGRWLMMLLLMMLTSMATRAAEAYACYTPSNTTLTFYYDNLRATRTGTTYDLNTGDNDVSWYLDGSNYDVTRVVFDPSFNSARPTNTCNWFCNMTGLQSITGLNYLNTSEVAHMTSMFAQCIQLTNLDVSNFNTANVTDMCAMFSNCAGLTNLDVSGFNTANVTDMSYMFNNCNSLTSLDVSNFNTANVTDMYAMFWKCSGLTNLDVSGFNTVNVTDMAYMFNECLQLSSLDLSDFNTGKVGKMQYMFHKCRMLSTIYVGDEWSTATVNSSENMFQNCTSLVGGKGTTYDPNYTDVAYAHIDGGPSDPGYFTDINAPTGPEAYAVYTSDNTTLTFYYDTERDTRVGTTFDMPAENSQPGWCDDVINAAVTQVVFDDSFADARLTTTNYMFYYMYQLTTITGIENLNTSSVTSMHSMFEGCSNLRNIDLSGFNTENVTNMGAMFFSCNRLTSIDVSHFNTENVTSMYAMFTGCRGLASLDLSNLNTANVIDMSFMFTGCNQLSSLDLSNFSTGKVRSMQFLFQNCTKLSTIYAGEAWSTTTVNSSENMFQNCTSLVGGKGTTYDANHIDKAYAHIDGGPSDPGYFTAMQVIQRGDANGDGNVTIVDVTALINYLLGDSGSDINLTGADCNTDGGVTITDVTTLINFLLGGSW